MDGRKAPGSSSQMGDDRPENISQTSLCLKTSSMHISSGMHQCGLQFILEPQGHGTWICLCVCVGSEDEDDGGVFIHSHQPGYSFPPSFISYSFYLSCFLTLCLIFTTAACGYLMNTPTITGGFLYTARKSSRQTCNLHREGLLFPIVPLGARCQCQVHFVSRRSNIVRQTLTCFWALPALPRIHILKKKIFK